MGDAGVATSADAYSMHWNTSKTVFSEHKSELGYTNSSWLRGLVEDITLSTLSGYLKVGDKHVIGGSMTYFILSRIFFRPIFPSNRQLKPREIQLLTGYAFQINQRHSVGVNVKYIRSNIIASNQGETEGHNLATDMSYFYLNQDLKIGSKESTFSIGANISNLGNKMTYSTAYKQDFMPTNLRVGTSVSLDLHEKHAFRTSIDFNKSLVPTPALMDGSGLIISGKNNDVSFLAGAIQSFYDAPGVVKVTPTGVEVEQGSRLKEELNEITIGGGIEYVFNDLLIIRSGCFYEHASKGNRKFISSGIGVRWRFLELDLAYYSSLTNNNSPVKYVLRSSLIYKIKKPSFDKNGF